MTNVKPGQLAMFKPGCGNNSGRIVRVIAPDLRAELQEACTGPWWSCEAMQRIERLRGRGDRWERMADYLPGEVCAAPDEALMPLHDGDAEDETLTWAGKPAPVDATLTPRRQVEHSR